MKNPIERLLYVTLVLIFIGLGLALYVVALVIHTQSEQIKKIEAINQAQTRTIAEIRATQTNIEASDQRNAKVIICMLQVPVAQRTPDLEQNCRAQVAQATQVAATTPASSSSPSQPSRSPSPSPNPTPSSSPAPSPQPQPSPQPPSPVSRLLQFLGL